MFYNGSIYFYPRSPCGERRESQQPSGRPTTISIHALLAESDNRFITSRQLPTPFLSTLSLRRVTHTKGNNLSYYFHFYPRSPCGERLAYRVQLGSMVSISIHALLAESDSTPRVKSARPTKFLSTLSLRRATRVGIVGNKPYHSSIHALLAESDAPRGPLWAEPVRFLSTLSLRRATANAR